MTTTELKNENRTLRNEKEKLEAENRDLQEQLNRMLTIFDSLSEGVVAASIKGEFLLANPTAQGIVGMGPTDDPPDEWSEHYGTFYPDKVTPVPNEQLPLIRAMQGEVTNNIELFIRNEQRPEGVSISVSGRPLHDASGELIGGVILLRNITELKAIQDRFTETMSSFQNQTQVLDAIFNSISDGLIVVNEYGQYVMFNARAEEMGAAKLHRKHIKDAPKLVGLFRPDGESHYPVNELPLTRALLGENADNVEMLLQNETLPHAIHISTSGRPILSNEGHVTGAVAVLRDITRLKRTESRLKESVDQLEHQSQLLETVFNSIGDSVVVVDEDSNYVMFNKRADEIGGLKLRKKKSTDSPWEIGLFLTDGKSRFPEDRLPLILALQGRNSDNVEMVMRNEFLPEDMHVSVTGRPIMDNKGKITGGVAVVRDITRLKLTEERLRKTITQLEHQTQLFESVFNNISDGIVVADELGKLTMFNPTAEQIAGGPQLDVSIPDWTEKYGMYCMDKETEFPTDELPLVRAIRGESTDNVEMFVRNPSIPEGAYISVSGRPLRDENGKHHGGVAVFRDMTERVRAAERLNQAFAEGRLEVVETILHNIGNAINSVAVGVDTVYKQLAEDVLSSRLNALANALKAHQEDLGDYVTNHPQGQKVLPFILALASDLDEADRDLKQTIERVREKTSHIVDIVRTQKSHGSTTDLRKDINLAEALSSAVKVLHESIESRNIRIDIHCDEMMEDIRIQESQFHQMIVNMVKNSIEAIDELERTGEPTEAPFIEIRSVIDEDSLYIDIMDNGIGLGGDQSDAIFSAGYTTKQTGTGLGLHSSANFVIAAGGKISASSDGYGKGTAIHIVFPRSRIATDLQVIEEVDGQS